jgi:hypothetical protein
MCWLYRDDEVSGLRRLHVAYCEPNIEQSDHPESNNGCCDVDDFLDLGA